MLGSRYLPYYLGSFDMNYIISEMLNFFLNVFFFFFLQRIFLWGRKIEKFSYMEISNIYIYSQLMKVH
jgi:hypothetical protein